MKQEIPPQRLRELRDMTIRFAYDNGAARPYFFVTEDELSKGIGISGEELSKVAMLMMNQGLIAKYAPVGTIGLSDLGQAEAERLGPAVLMREPSPSGTVVVNASYSVVQIAGHNSTLTANYSLKHSEIASVLEEIEQELPRLSLSPAAVNEAKGLIDDCRKGIVGKMGSAGLRAMGASLSSLLTSGGSELGKRLIGLLGIGS